MSKPDLISDERLEELLAASPAPRVTPEYMNSRIKSVDFVKLGESTTICSINLDNGYSVRGESSCVNPENYKEEIGQKVAFDSAMSKLWGFFGFLMAEKRLLAERELEKEALAATEDDQEGTDINVLADKIHARVADIHKDSGVSSDVTQAVHSAVKEALEEAA